MTIAQGTVAVEIAPRAQVISLTRPTTKILTDETGFLRTRARLLSQEVDETHQRTHQLEWQILSGKRGTAAPQKNLEQLADLGFAWRDLARLLGVSVPAIQKWRKGEGVSGDNRRKVASLLAACDLISEHYLIEEIASWFEMPLVDDVPVTPVDLWAQGRPELVFDYAGGHVDPETTLGLFDSDWKERYSSNFESFVGEDGNRSLRMKD
ncbi:MAG: hypothetical protein H7201_12125 [Candidatus Saccharibacteria bacterium]|nr:hypothetical protein [Microbacteriaceae bacterium]